MFISCCCLPKATLYLSYTSCSFMILLIFFFHSCTPSAHNNIRERYTHTYVHHIPNSYNVQAVYFTLSSTRSNTESTFGKWKWISNEYSCSQHQLPCLSCETTFTYFCYFFSHQQFRRGWFNTSIAVCMYSIGYGSQRINKQWIPELPLDFGAHTTHIQ